MAIHSEKTAKLSSGYEMPVIGFGTSFSTTSDIPNEKEVENSVKIALESGYRHIDCAPAYENEAAVGKGIKASGIPREEIFITSKLWNTEHDPKDVGPALDATLKDLDIEYIDLYLIHWPSSWVKLEPYTLYPEDKDGNMISNSIPLTTTWAAMEKLVESGKARSIGVSNFGDAYLEEILAMAKIVPAVNQLQVQPYRQRKEQLARYLSRGIHMTAWGPITTDRATQTNVMSDPALIKIAQPINITPVQLALSWAVQRGTSVIPNSSKPERVRSNLKIVHLPKEVMEQVNNLEMS